MGPTGSPPKKFVGTNCRSPAFLFFRALFPRPFGVDSMGVGWMLLASAGMAILADLPKPSRASELRRMMASPEWKEAVKDGSLL